MRPIPTAWLTIAGITLATIGARGDASAQYRLPVLVSAVKADSMHSTATVYAAAGRWADAARLHRRSAELRAPDDPQGFRCYQAASQLGYAVGNLSGSRTDMTRAANQALTRGDLLNAALAYVDAAWVAQAQNKPSKVWDLGRRAEMLAASPLLGSADRRAILGRIKHEPETTKMAIRQAP
jgi:hypothetical protein